MKNLTLKSVQKWAKRFGVTVEQMKPYKCDGITYRYEVYTDGSNVEECPTLLDVLVAVRSFYLTAAESMV